MAEIFRLSDRQTPTSAVYSVSGSAVTVTPSTRKEPGAIFVAQSADGARKTYLVWDGIYYPPESEWDAIYSETVKGLSIHGMTYSYLKARTLLDLSNHLYYRIGFGGSQVIDWKDVAKKIKKTQAETNRLVGEAVELGLLLKTHDTARGKAYRMNPNFGAIMCDRLALAKSIMRMVQEPADRRGSAA